MPSLVSVFRGLFSNRRASVVGRGALHISTTPSFTPVALKDFLALDIPQRASLLHPVLPQRGLAMLYSPRGIGKSWLGLSIAVAVSTGLDLLRWSSPELRRVLYVDGEMPLADLQQRLAMIAAGFQIETPNENFRLLAADQIERGINLSNPEDQHALESHFDGVDLVILDNLSTLTTSSEGASDAWLPIQNWLLKLRRRGVSVLLIHHAGLNGRQRGTSRREDALDTVIALRHPRDYRPAQGCRFEVHIEKARMLSGEGAAPFEASIETFADRAGKAAIRRMACDLKPPILDQAAKLYRQGLTVRQVEAALGISHGKAGRLRKRAEAGGLLDDTGEDGPEEETATGDDLRLN
jgi:putative DNA primase/helicase